MRLHELLLAVAKRDAGFLVDQLPKEAELFLGERDCGVIRHGELKSMERGLRFLECDTERWQVLIDPCCQTSRR